MHSMTMICVGLIGFVIGVYQVRQLPGGKHGSFGGISSSKQARVRLEVSWSFEWKSNCWSQHLEMGQYWQKVDMRQWKLNQAGSFSNQVEYLICARISESSFSYCEMFAFRWQVGRGWATHSRSRGWEAPREATTCRQVLRFINGW